jgi:hypothetical protein
MANVPKRRVVVVDPRIDEASSDGIAAKGAVQKNGAKSGGRETQAREPWPVEFGWDFPFDFPKPVR